MSLTGATEEAGLDEVDLSIKRLFHWAAYADKYGGNVQVSVLECPTFSFFKSL